MIKLLCVDAKGKRQIKEGLVYTQREEVTCSCGAPRVVTLEEVKNNFHPAGTVLLCDFCDRELVSDGHNVYARARFIQINDPDLKETESEEEKCHILVDPRRTRV